MAEIILGVGDLHASCRGGDRIKTFALGSCVALILYDLKTKAAGMAHVALPEARINPERAREKPGSFADSGTLALFAAMTRLRGREDKAGLVVKLAGGANVLRASTPFNIGDRNVQALRRELQKWRLSPAAEDVGGVISRTVSIDVTSGKVFISSSDGEMWTL